MDGVDSSIELAAHNQAAYHPKTAILGCVSGNGTRPTEPVGKANIFSIAANDALG
jgi:hypothetical protein